MTATYTYKACDAKFAAKKALKAIKAHDWGNPRLPNYLSTIMIFADENHLPKITTRVLRIVDGLCGADVSYGEIVEAMTGITKKLCKINEKRTIMSIRESHAQIKFAQTAKKRVEKCADELKRFDVVKVPTMGGMHYSIVWDIDTSYVICFPMTTASSSDLKFLGLQSVSLSGCGDERYDGIRLTTSATKVSIDDARGSFYDSVADNPKICKKVEKIAYMSAA